MQKSIHVKDFEEIKIRFFAILQNNSFLLN